MYELHIKQKEANILSQEKEKTKEQFELSVGNSVQEITNAVDEILKEQADKGIHINIIACTG